MNRYDAIAVICGFIALGLLGAWIVSEDWQFFVMCVLFGIIENWIGYKYGLLMRST